MIQCFIMDRSIITDERLNALRCVLSTEELKRLKQLKTPKRQREFIVGRALIKNVCAKRFKTIPNAIKIGVHHNGAPFLTQYPDCFISLSHSNKYVLMALADTPVGIDIEHHRKRHFDDLMKRLFSDEIPMDWSKKTPDEKETFFYRCWTQKEASFKLKCQSNQRQKIYFETVLFKVDYTLSISSYNSIKTNINLIELN